MAGVASAAFQPAVPKISITTPHRGASYERGAHVVARFHCTEGGRTGPITACQGTVPDGHTMDMRSTGTKSFTVTAVAKSGLKVSKTIHYTVWAYVDPVKRVAGLEPGRIDMGVD